ncbi:glucosaminidase domain-containing protein [Gelria sp. Kuro-4]|uniref:glucosaminidase domain-containing protein n=1 Tax=Gelria sp. Kuro-4 TaxID=2796927 RepID=UPI001BF055DF|nr:glucosaminidase domain-containing protein [Gelria sp. Kuro-4]BCV23306.1 hypothetical protein kuro4_00790 [Gelria sp. Kuro-4]
MRLYTPDATRKLLRPTLDRCGYILDYEGQTTALVAAPPHWGTVSVTDVLKALAALNEQFPLGWLKDFPVFITDLQYMYYDGRTWSDTGTVAKTYPQYIIICAQADFDEPRAAMVITHELGHAVMLHLTDSKEFYGKETPMLAAYRKLRNLGPEINYGWAWEDQLYEVFAEDFRWLFGSSTAKLERFRTMDEAVDPKPPSEEIRRWFLDLIPKPVPEFHVQVITGKEESQEMRPGEFIDLVKLGAIESYRKYGILPSITIAQAALESGWGKAHIQYNLFGIKWTEGCGYAKVAKTTTEYVNGVAKTVTAYFRGYKDFNESILDHAKLLASPRYLKVRQAKNYQEAARALQECGYATDPEYADKLVSIITAHALWGIDKEVSDVFRDIEGHWAKADIEAVAKAGLMSGYPDGRFGPDEPVTRAQLAAVVNRLLKREG